MLNVPGARVALRSSSDVRHSGFTIWHSLSTTNARYTVGRRERCQGPATTWTDKPEPRLPTPEVRASGGDIAAPSSSRRNKVDEQLVSTGYAGRELAEPGVARVDVDAFAHVHEQLAARLRILAGVVRCHHGIVLRVPLLREVEAAFLDPAVEILRHDLVRDVEERVFRLQQCHWRFLDGDAVPRVFERVAVG